MLNERNRVVARLIVVMLCATIAVPVVCAQQAENVSAWKPEQHVPIGVTALDDLLEDNLLEIDGVEYPANPLALSAIKLFPEYYLMGCMGPDVYPDVLYGQCFIHPDNRDLMACPGTSYSYEWIDLLMNRAINLYYAGDYDTSMKAIAFTYGFMTHYAGDMFGHTYINRLAGGPWDLDLRGYDNAIRHLAIESFINQRTDYQGGLWDQARHPFAYAGIPIDPNDGKPRDLEDFCNDAYFNMFLLDVFYRDPKAVSLFEGVTGNSKLWASLWQLLIGLEGKVDDYIAELDKPVEDRSWWAKPSPIYDVLKKYFKDWKELISEGLYQWMRTSTMVGIFLFDVKSGSMAWECLKEWATNYLVGMVMGPLVDVIVDFFRGWKEWYNVLQVGLTGGFSLLWDYFIGWVTDQTMEVLVNKIFEYATGIPWNDYEMAMTNPAHIMVNEEHSDLWGISAGSPYTGEGTMQDILYDMNTSFPADGSTGFDPMKFPPTYNSIMMSKLLLMDGKGLNSMLHNYGVKDDLYLDISPTEMKDLNQYRSNIMFGQMLSLDADHQWMAHAPNSFEEQPGGASWGMGMPIWENSEAREKCFKKVFHMGTEVTFEKLKVATRWNVDTTLNLTITNNAYRDGSFKVEVTTSGFGDFTGCPQYVPQIRRGETIPYTVHFVCGQVDDRDYAGGKITVKVTPMTALGDVYNLYGNEASCIVVAFPTDNRVFWLDIDEPAVLTYNDSLACPAVQPFVPNQVLRPFTIFDPINGTLGPLPVWKGEPSAYVSSLTHMRLYGFSEDGGYFKNMSVRYTSASHYGMNYLGVWQLYPCPDFKQSPWTDLRVKEVNYVDVGYQSGHVVDVLGVPRLYPRVSFFSSSFTQDPHVYYFNFDQMMAAENATGLIEWSDDVYRIEYKGITNQDLVYDDSFVVYLDNTAPKTTIHLDKVKDATPDPIVITPDCSVSFDAFDGKGSGVQGTFYKIVRNMTVVSELSAPGQGTRQMVNDSKTVVPWTAYDGTFNFSELVKYGHSGDVYDIIWYSFDGVSNMEARNSMRFTLVYDVSPPSTSLSVGTPSVPATLALADAYVTDETSVTLSATDCYEPLDPALTGVLATKYRILNGGYDSGWLAYNGPFTLSGAPDGPCHIDYMSTDKNLNAEPTKREEVILDTTAPITEVSATGPSKATLVGHYVEPSATLSIVAVDAGSGVSSSEYRIVGSGEDTGWRPYVGPVGLDEFSPGDYVLQYRSTDNMSNTEQNRSSQLSVVAASSLSSSLYSVSGCIRDQDTDLPVVGAIINAGSFSCMTNETGYYSVLVANGTLDIAVSADGYDGRSVSVTVSGEDVIRDIGLAASGGGGTGTENVSMSTAGIIILLAMISAGMLSILGLRKLGAGRHPKEPPPPES